MNIRNLLPVSAAIFLATNCSASLADDEYRKVVEARASRIVDTLAIADDEQAQRVIVAVADQYAALSEAHDRRDESLENSETNADAVRDASHREIVELHRRFLARLSTELSHNQVEAVKDGMTYGVVPHTYKAYLHLLPDLSDEQKRFVLANLLEAREHAMDAGSSREKHRWFGKYKGRINNYLSQAGYDLKKAERDLAERTKRPASR